MANSLNVNLKVDEAVQLKDHQIVYCKSGFGMTASTVGSALFVENKKGDTFRVSGFDILCRVKERDEMNELLQAIMHLKTIARRNICPTLTQSTRLALHHSATYHAIDILETIAGWEAAAISGDTTFDLYKKVKQIYQDQVDKMT